MDDNQLETITMLAQLIRKARLYNLPLGGGVLAVPVTDIAEALEKFTTTIEPEGKPNE